MLYVDSLSTTEMAVRAVDGFNPDAAFDYVVFGLRIGFEEIPSVKPKREGEEAFIPSMAEERALLAERPDLRRYTAFDRFAAMRAEAFPELGAEPDTSRAKALVAAIHEYDPATDGEVGRPGPSRP
ncbi:MAG: hypothetical protein D6738_15550 [Acidobacteria bacterium]|nr:MAG: hypothetical protein D6738_15550 [Acidobacteriota bacterium]